MTPKGTLFFDEWQACLRAHYIHVIRTQDMVTEPTLRHVLLTTGLTEDELADLRAEALGAAGDVRAAIEAPVPVAAPLPDEMEPPDELGFEHEAEAQASALDDDVSTAELHEQDALDVEFPPDDPDQDTDESEAHEPYSPPPGQLSLF